jgi:hypothetical protein
MREGFIFFVLHLKGNLSYKEKNPSLFFLSFRTLLILEYKQVLIFLAEYLFRFQMDKQEQM